MHAGSDPLAAELSRSARVLHVRLRDGARPPPRRPWLEQLILASRRERRVLAIHVEQLAGLDSPLLADLVWLVLRAHDAGVGLAVSYDGGRPWQAMSLRALRRALRSEGEAGTAVSFLEV